MSKHNKDLNVILPLRSKSKSIKDKNLLKIGKYPMAIRCIRTILKSRLGDKIIIATDSEEYIKKIKDFFKNNKKIIYFLRSKKAHYLTQKQKL